MQILHSSSSELSFEGGEEDIDITDAVTGFEEILVGFVFESEFLEITGSDDEVGITGAVDTTGEAGADDLSPFPLALDGEASRKEKR